MRVQAPLGVARVRRAPVGDLGRRHDDLGAPVDVDRDVGGRRLGEVRAERGGEAGDAAEVVHAVLDIQICGRVVELDAERELGDGVGPLALVHGEARELLGAARRRGAVPRLEEEAPRLVHELPRDRRVVRVFLVVVVVGVLLAARLAGQAPLGDGAASASSSAAAASRATPTSATPYS